MFAKWAALFIIAGFFLFSSATSPLWAQAPYNGQVNTYQGYNTAMTPTTDNVLIILDASDSMNEKINGRSKIQIAKEVILKTIQSMPPNVNVGLRVYGHRLGTRSVTFTGPFGTIASDNSACRQTELMVPLAMNNRATIASRLLSVEAVGKTPISYTIEQAAAGDFAGRSGKKTIILVSDGRETCAQNPCNLALELVRNRVDVKINTIGFGTNDHVADDQLRCIALATKGKFYSTSTAAELANSLRESTQSYTSVQAQIVPSSP